MITYLYHCQSCDITVEFQQSVRDSPKKKCPHCKKFQLQRLICSPTILVRQDIKTLGQLAEHNTKKAGRYELAEKRQRQKTSAEKGKEVKSQAIAEKFKGKIPERIKDYKPWYGKPTKDVNKMNREQQTRYIMGED